MFGSTHRKLAKNFGKQHFVERRFFLLFLFLLTYLIFYPYAQHSGSQYLAYRVFGTTVTLMGVYAVSFRRSFVILAVLLAIPTLIQRIALPAADKNVLSLVSTMLGFAFDIFIVVVIFRSVFARDETSSETIYGALCIYLLAGFGFATVYQTVNTLQAHAFYFDPAVSLRNLPDRFDFIYYSFGTLTSLGAAGITPVSDQARSLSVIESILGVLYLAVLISRLMNSYRYRGNE